MLESMLGKGFKASKCKTLLRLAMARIKLLRNKRDLQIRMLRKDIAQLLSTGQEPSARIRVEHIIREQNIMAAYDIIELFCELVVVRLPIIESQKICPMDLKEAISSLIFASPRCADLEELLEIRTLFAAKYGKEFAAAAAELRPNCGVNRRIIEKLSVRAPSGETKLKLMKEIAAEHNVDWDPTDSEAELLKTPEDLLDGPNHFLAAHQMPMPAFVKEETHDSPVRSTSQVPPSGSNPPISPPTPSSPESPAAKQFIPFVLPTKGKLPPPGKYDSPPRTAPVARETAYYKEGQQPPSEPSRRVSGKFNAQASSPQDQWTAGEDARRNVSRNPEENEYTQVKEGKMDYKDVAAAAQAAANSADRAVAAARAAAELAKKAEYGHTQSNENAEYSRDGSAVPNQNAAARDGSSDTTLDSPTDSDDEEPPVKNEEEVPRGRGPGGTKTKPSFDEYWRSETRRSFDEPGFTSGATKLQFNPPEFPGASSKPVFDEYDEDKETKDNIFLRSGRSGKQEPEFGDKGWQTVHSSKSQQDKLRWQSPQGSQGSGKYDIFDLHLEKMPTYTTGIVDDTPTDPHSSVGGSDYYFGKPKSNIVKDGDSSGTGEYYRGSGDSKSQARKPLAESRRSYGAKPAPKNQERSPLFDDESGANWPVDSSLPVPGHSEGQLKFNSQYDASPSTSPPKFNDYDDSSPGVRSYLATTKSGSGSWAQQRTSESSYQPPQRPAPPINSSPSQQTSPSTQNPTSYSPGVPKYSPSPEGNTRSPSVHPKLPDYDDLTARFEALKSKR